MELWVKEIHQDKTGLSFKVKQTLFSGKSAFQKVDIIETIGLGRMLLNDGVFMFSQADEFIYHEMMAHVPLFTHPCPKNVLIIGGGDGGTAREVLKHQSVERVVMVEIDEMVVTACREYLPTLSCALNHPKLDLNIGDGVDYAATTKERFDVILVDSTDPVGSAEPLFNADFYRNTARILSDDGILITQAESPFYDGELQRTMLANQRDFFKYLHLYLFPTLTYPGGLWGFGFASEKYSPIRDFNPERVRTSGLSFQYYNADIHRSAFVLPTFIADNLKGIIDPL